MTTDEKAMAYTARICNQTGIFTKGEVETAFVTGYNEAITAFEKEYGWHDLKDDVNDLPNDGDYVAVELPLTEDEDSDTEIVIALFQDGEFECVFGEYDLNTDRDFNWKRIY